MPFKRIADRLGISVATAHVWTRDIVLTPEQIHRNLHGPRGPANPEVVAARVRSWKLRNRRKRIRYQQEGREQARRGDRLHQAGCMLYWAEGSKHRNSVTLANSDVALVRFFCRFLRESMGVEPESFTINLNVYTNNGLSIEEIETHWLHALDLPRSCLRQHSLNSLPTSSSGRKKNKLPYGVCTVRVHSTRLVQHVYGAIQEYGGFEEPAWLDGPPRKPANR